MNNKKTVLHSKLFIMCLYTKFHIDLSNMYFQNSCFNVRELRPSKHSNDYNVFPSTYNNIVYL